MQVRFNSKTPEHKLLSNFDETPFTLRLKCGTFRFMNAEAAFHLCKHEVITPELANAWRIMTPNQARTNGRKIKLRSDWHEVRLEAMSHVLSEKFSERNPLHLDFLRRYAPGTQFIHDAPWDGFWGTGKDGKGVNMMGKLITGIARADYILNAPTN